MGYRWKFRHGTRVVEFGPYDSEWEASVHFQWRYGYWQIPFDKEEYNGISN